MRGFIVASAGGLLLLVAQDPGRADDKNYSITESATGSIIPRAVVTHIDVPPDKSYAELTDEQKRTVRSLYEKMPEGDVPPYPLHGPQRIMEAAAKVQQAMRLSGELTLAVTVSTKGVPVSVQMLRSPDATASKLLASVLMVQKYTPASCKGVPCQMQYPIRFDFTLK